MIGRHGHRRGPGVLLLVAAVAGCTSTTDAAEDDAPQFSGADSEAVCEVGERWDAVGERLRKAKFGSARWQRLYPRLVSVRFAAADVAPDEIADQLRLYSDGTERYWRGLKSIDFDRSRVDTISISSDEHAQASIDVQNYFSEVCRISLD